MTDALFRFVVDALPVGVVVVDAGGTVVMRNRAALTIWGRIIENAEERLQISRGRWHETGEPVQPHEWASARALADNVRCLDQLIDIEAFDGTHRTLRNSAVPIRGEAGVEGAVVLLEDITDRVRLEAELAHAQKLEALGRLAGGVAHDFNNLLMVIFSYSESLIPTMEPADSRREDLEEIRRAAESARGLTAQLLAFGRRDVQRPRNVILERAVEEAHKLLVRVLGDHIEVVTDLSSSPSTIWIDPLQLEQMIVNLALNARDAMPRGGTLTFATATRDTPGARVATLVVTDTGVGMDEPTRARIFEPFFTTKARGRGTGLGLAAVHGAVERSGGAIRVRSTPGVGTTFEIDLPLSTRTDVAEPAPAGQAKAALPVDPGSIEILLVEDNSSVRAAVRAMLAVLDYRITDLPDARAALAHLGSGARVDLLITDVVLLGANGRELADAVAAQWPAVRVLFMSGYADDEELQQGQTVCPILAKPFSIDALAEAVRKALGH